jgi:O-antigen ligase
MTINRFLCQLFGILLIGGALVVPRAYGMQKLSILMVLLALILFSFFIKKTSVLIWRPIVFFVIISAINALALFVGVLYGNSNQAIIDGLRLGVIYPIVIALLWTALADFAYGKYINTIVELSAISIFIIIFLAIFQHIGVINVYTETFLEENALRVGLHEGFVQVTSHNVGSLFFISGYLLYHAVACHRKNLNILSAAALICALLAAMLSGRRALQLAIFLAPIFLIFTAKIFSEKKTVTKKIIKLWLIIVFGLLFVLVYFFSNGHLNVDSFIDRFALVFVDDGGARTSQAASLYSAFLSYPFFGSGIGGISELVRSEDAPWVYELTYLQLLFNFGIVGTALFGALFFSQIWRVRCNSRYRRINYSIEERSMFSGAFFLIFGAATNPYLGSFDFMLMIGIVPFVANTCFGKRPSKIRGVV